MIVLQPIGMNSTIAFLYVLPGDAADVGQSFRGIVALEFSRAIDGRGAPFADLELILSLLKLLVLIYLANHGTIIDEPQQFRALLLWLDVCFGNSGRGSIIIT